MSVENKTNPLPEGGSYIPQQIDPTRKTPHVSVSGSFFDKLGSIVILTLGLAWQSVKIVAKLFAVTFTPRYAFQVVKGLESCSSEGVRLDAFIWKKLFALGTDAKAAEVFEASIRGTYHDTVFSENSTDLEKNTNETYRAVLQNVNDTLGFAKSAAQQIIPAAYAVRDAKREIENTDI